jgi:hypothetical protein
VSELLFLAHRMPYPPDKGDKIRSWHFLQGLARRHVVHLGAFVDDPVDWQHRPVLERVCGELCLRSLPVRLATARSALGLLNGEPLTLPYYRDRGMMRWVRELAQRRRLDGVFVFSSSMAQYAAALPSTAAGRRVLDLCDVDSDKWRQYAGAHGWPMNLVYAREARLLEQRERRYVESFDATVVIADPDLARSVGACVVLIEKNIVGGSSSGRSAGFVCAIPPQSSSRSVLRRVQRPVVAGRSSSPAESSATSREPCQSVSSTACAAR